MSFDNDYKQIKNVVKDESDRVEKALDFNSDNPFYQTIKEFVNAPSKRLRPILTILFLKSLKREVDEAQIGVIAAIELIHNATLIHDDVIDDASFRRGQSTINKRFTNNMAVVAGDYLLSLALEKITCLNSPEITALYANTLKGMCDGEVIQYLNRFKVPLIEDYIHKSICKTALLFETAISSAILAGTAYDNKDLAVAKDFAKNFGIAFQIRDDLLNITENAGMKPTKNDFDSGIYTAPVIFAENSANPEQGIEKTEDLMDNYFRKSLLALEKLEDNEYKQALVSLVELFRNAKK